MDNPNYNIDFIAAHVPRGQHKGFPGIINTRYYDEVLLYVHTHTVNIDFTPSHTINCTLQTLFPGLMIFNRKPLPILDNKSWECTPGLRHVIQRVVNYWLCASAIWPNDEQRPLSPHCSKLFRTGVFSQHENFFRNIGTWYIFLRL